MEQEASLPSIIWLHLSNQSNLLTVSHDQPIQHIKKQRHYFADKSSSSQSHGFSSSHVWMWELDYKESWALKNWCFWTVVLEKTFVKRANQSILKEISPEYSLEGERCWSWNSNTLATWCKEMTNLKRPWCWERLKAGGEGDDRGWDIGWHHWLNGQEFE